MLSWKGEACTCLPEQAVRTSTKRCVNIRLRLSSRAKMLPRQRAASVPAMIPAVRTHIYKAMCVRKVMSLPIATATDVAGQMPEANSFKLSPSPCSALWSFKGIMVRPRWHPDISSVLASSTAPKEWP